MTTAKLCLALNGLVENARKEQRPSDADYLEALRKATSTPGWLPANREHRAFVRRFRRALMSHAYSEVSGATNDGLEFTVPFSTAGRPDAGH